MIRIRFKHLLDDKSFRERKRITIAEVVEATGVSKATLSRIANSPGYNANLDAINALCGYFECTPGELLEYVRDEED
jgi:putative transcriptional regulator